MHHDETHRVDIIEPHDRYGLWEMVDELRAGRVWPEGNGRVTRIVPVIHGEEGKPLASWAQLIALAKQHVIRPGVSVQIALRNLPNGNLPNGNPPTGWPEAGPWKHFLKDLEALIVVRHAHEPDIRTAMVDRGLGDLAREMADGLLEYYRTETTP